MGRAFFLISPLLDGLSGSIIVGGPRVRQPGAVGHALAQVGRQVGHIAAGEAGQVDRGRRWPATQPGYGVLGVLLLEYSLPWFQNMFWLIYWNKDDQNSFK